MMVLIVNELLFRSAEEALGIGAISEVVHAARACCSAVMAAVS